VSKSFTDTQKQHMPTIPISAISNSIWIPAMLMGIFGATHHLSQSSDTEKNYLYFEERINKSNCRDYFTKLAECHREKDTCEFELESFKECCSENNICLNKFFGKKEE